MHSLAVFFTLCLVSLHKTDGVRYCYERHCIVCSPKTQIESCEDPHSLCASNTYTNTLGETERVKTCVDTDTISYWATRCKDFNEQGGSCYLCNSELCNLEDQI